MPALPTALLLIVDGFMCRIKIREKPAGTRSATSTERFCQAVMSRESRDR
jgi:hypothetical protein